MILRTFENRQLAHYAYLVGCPGSGEAVVIDAGRDLEPILAAAAEEGLRIVAVTETHIHADYVSGSRELAKRTGATLYLSAEGGPDWQYAFSEEPNVKLVRDGDAIGVGAVRLDVVHTPGHTPEHLTFVLTDESASPTPLGAFTGDFIFVGDVGRPDLLERAAGFEGTMATGAVSLFRSLRAFTARMPDSLLIWPAHGAGSACGKSLGGVPVTTLGYERRVNWALQIDDESVFVDAVLSGQPEPPFYFKEMKRLNKVGPPLVADVPPPSHMGPALLRQALLQGDLVVDTRPSTEALASLAVGALNIPLGKQFANVVGWFAEYGTPISLIARNKQEAEEAAQALRGIGLDQVPSWFDHRAVESLEDTVRIPVHSPDEVAQSASQLGSLLLDVRGAIEVASAPVPGSTHIPLGHLVQRAFQLPKDKPIIAFCASGGRAAIAATVLRRAGLSNVSAMKGRSEDLASCLQRPGATLR